MRPTTIHAAILGERGAGEACDPHGVRGNADEQYPRPLTCDVCCARPLKDVDTIYELTLSGQSFVWYVTESDPLPDGWQRVIDPDYGYAGTLCPECFPSYYQNGREEEEYDY